MVGIGGGEFKAATACPIKVERPVLGVLVGGVVVVEPPLLDGGTEINVVVGGVVVGVVVVLTVKVYVLLPSVPSLGCGGMYGVGCGYVCGGGYTPFDGVLVGVVSFVVVVVDEP